MNKENENIFVGYVVNLSILEHFRRRTNTTTIGKK